MNTHDIAMLQEAQVAHRKAVQAVLGPNMALQASPPMHRRGPHRRFADESDRKVRLLQRRLKMLAQAADLSGQPGLGDLAEAILKETEED